MATSLMSVAPNAMGLDGDTSLQDGIDILRSQGVNHIIGLPQLIVCGDQSSGKSSVLEAISHIPFPRKDNFCTRFPTEIILRRSAYTRIAVSIVPAVGRSDAHIQSLLSFQETLTSFDDLPNLIEKAEKVMGLNQTNQGFGEDTLRIETSSPDHPHLTIVDLPGLIHTPNRDQTKEDVNIVQRMIRRHMRNRRSVILAVVTALNDVANQIVLRLAGEVDPEGHRTLGIITKPDRLNKEPMKERTFLELAQNQITPLRLGWHALRNRSYDERNYSHEIRDVTEKEFFNQGIWASLPRSDVGIESLRRKLSRVLLNQIRTELPSLIADIEAEARKTDLAIKQLGTSRRTEHEQLFYLVDRAMLFQRLVKSAVDGLYEDPFFSDSQEAEGCSRRLRAVMQNLNTQFCEEMRLKGHRRKIGKDGELGELQVRVSREEFLADITSMRLRSRGRELPGLFNPLIITELFIQQSQPWETLATSHLEAVWNASRTFLAAVVAHVLDERMVDSLLVEVINPRMGVIRDELQGKLKELLTPYQSSHPITYNQDFTKAMQNFRLSRKFEGVKEVLSTQLGLTNLNIVSKETHAVRVNIVPARLFEGLVQAMSPSEVATHQYASHDILDCMQAYYDVALKSIVDNVAIYVVEAILVKALEHLLSQSVISQMPSEQIARIVAESDDTTKLRKQLIEKQCILRKGLETCRKHLGPLIAARSAVQDTESEDGESEGDTPHTADAKGAD